MIKKRVLVIMTTPFDGYGISVVVKNYCYHLKDLVCFDFLLCAGCSENENAFFQNNSFNTFVPGISRNKHPLLYRKWLKSFILSNRYDVVHAHGNSGTLFFDISAAKKANVEIRIAHCHNSSCNHKLVHYLLKRSLNRIATIKLACSDLAGKWLFGKGYLVLNNAIDADSFSFSPVVRDELRKNLNLCEEKVLLNVGRLHKQKNQLFLINVMQKLLSLDKSFKLIIVGDGPLRERIETEIATLRLEKSVILSGKKDEVKDFYSCADLFLFPSLYEGLGLVAVEAEASGLTVLASKNVPNEINITSNVCFLDLDIEKWAEAIIKHFKIKKIDREKTSETACFKIRANNYDIKTNSKTLLNIYNNSTE